MRHKVEGFSIVSTIFILVILGLASTYIISLSAVSRETSVRSIQGERAFFSARSGVEWAIREIILDSTQCPPNTVLSLTQGGLNGFQATVTCTATPYTEGTTTYNIFDIVSVAEFGSFGDSDYVSRRLSAKITLAS